MEKGSDAKGLDAKGTPERGSDPFLLFRSPENKNV